MKGCLSGCAIEIVAAALIGAALIAIWALAPYLLLEDRL